MSFTSVIVLIGVVTILVGFLIKSSPSLISGYGQMSDEQKANVDIEKLSKLYRNGFVSIGVLTIVGYYVFTWLEFKLLAELMLLLVMFPGILIMLIQGKKYDRNPKKLTTNIGIGLVLVVGIFIFTSIPYGMVPSEVTIDSSGVSFSGVYSTTFKPDDIESVELSDSLPPIRSKVSGFAIADIKKGYFMLKEYGKCRLFLDGYTKPFLVIKTKEGKYTIYNNPDNYVTKDIYSRINEYLKKEK